MSNTLLGHVAVEVLLGPEAAEEVLGLVQLGPLHACVGNLILKYMNLRSWRQIIQRLWRLLMG